MKKICFMVMPIVLMSLLVLAGCGGNSKLESTISTAAPEAVKLTVMSAAFGEGEMIPLKYTCAGQDISPPLNWSSAPEGTKSFTIIMTDPDAPGGVFTHWIIFNILPGILKLDEAVPNNPELANGARQATNSFRKIGYGGPCPPAGKPHHYIFTLYALDITVNMAANAGKAEILDAMKGHVLGQGQLTGLYQK